jgi:hypothetical protein
MELAARETMTNKLLFLICYDPGPGPTWWFERKLPAIPFIKSIYISWLSKDSAPMALMQMIGVEKYWGIYYENDGCNSRTFRAGPIEIRIDSKKLKNKKPWKIGFGI